MVFLHYFNAIFSFSLNIFWKISFEYHSEHLNELEHPIFTSFCKMFSFGDPCKLSQQKVLDQILFVTFSFNLGRRDWPELGNIQSTKMNMLKGTLWKYFSDWTQSHGFINSQSFVDWNFWIYMMCNLHLRLTFLTILTTLENELDNMNMVAVHEFC